ncbi:myrosinase 1-like [Eupeodes corollae]|uniref:myrosinase 1-like n=1 Tax=Eupeodes corollae TaxID=290404 RepID=UPI002490392D|nr:myrosinase 1-like [Eupeodes corollae]
MFSSFLRFIGIVGFIINALHKANSCDLPAKGNPYFPNNFSFGIATSAYQIEGGWDADGKGPSIWDDFTHNYSHLIDKNSTGDISADSYHHFDQDLAALKELKVNHYRFSISWPRIFPNGDISSRNQKGIDYYNKIIDKLLKNGIQPMVTMFHFDLPVDIQKIGGFMSDKFIEKFVAYATELFENFGDRVKIWMTFNEPQIFCKSSYADGRYPPLAGISGEGDYICVTNTLKAHAAVYKVYRSRFYEKQKGKISIALGNYFFLPKSNETEAAYRALQFNIGFLAHPIFHTSGGFPKVMIEDIKSNSLKEGRLTSRLPSLKGYWKNLIKGSADFFALNYYTSRMMQRAVQPKGLNPSWERDMDCDESLDPSWLKATSGTWLYCVPEGLEGMLKFLRDEYGDLEVMITENGWSDVGELDDVSRIRYLKSHLQAVLNGISSGSNITAYTYWSLIDNFEWRSGYSIKYGLYSVDFQSSNRERTPKKSANFYREVISSKKIPNEIHV